MRDNIKKNKVSNMGFYVESNNINNAKKKARRNTPKNKVVSGVDPVTGKFYSSSKSPTTVGKNLRTSNADPLFVEALPGAMTGNAHMAELIANAHAQLSRFSITSETASQGDPRIAPYRTVEINGTGATTDGNWIVKKAVHQCYYDGRYEVEFHCMTDGTGRNKSVNEFTEIRVKSSGKIDKI
jgi:hypothetical protein